MRLLSKQRLVEAKQPSFNQRRSQEPACHHILLPSFGSRANFFLNQNFWLRRKSIVLGLWLPFLLADLARAEPSFPRYDFFKGDSNTTGNHHTTPSHHILTQRAMLGKDFKITPSHIFGSIIHDRFHIALGLDIVKVDRHHKEASPSKSRSWSIVKPKFLAPRAGIVYRF